MAVNIGPKIGIDGEAEYRKAINNIIQQGKTLASEMEAVASSFDESTSQQEKNRKTSEVLNKQIDTQKERLKMLSDMLEKSTREFGESDTKTLKWKQAVNEATAQLNRMEKQLEDTTQETDDLGDEVESTSKKALSFGDVLKANVVSDLVVDGLRTMASAVADLGKEFLSTGLEYNKQMESYTTDFEIMLGSAAAAAETVESLKEMGASTPFEMSDLAAATKTLLAFNVKASDSEAILTQLGDISLGNVQKLESLTRAYGKMNASQKVSLEDINMMIDAGFNPLLLVADKTGQTMQEVYARISKGGVAFSEIQEAIKQATSEGGQFYKGMEKASKTTDGLISTLEDNAKALVGEVFEPVSDSLRTDLLPGAINAIEVLTDAFRENGIDGMIDASSEMLGSFTAELADGAPKLIKSGMSVAKSVVKGLNKNSGAVADAAGEIMEELVVGLADLTPDVIDGAADLFSGIVEAVPDTAMKLFRAMPQITDAIARGLLKGTGAVLTAVGKLLDPAEWKLLDVREQLEDIGDMVTPFADAISQAQGNVADLSKVLSDKGRTISEIDDMIEETEGKITEIFKREFAEQDGYRKSDLLAIKKYNDELSALQKEKIGVYRDQQNAELLKIKLAGDKLDEETVAKHIATAKALLEESNRIAEDIYTSELSQIENFYRDKEGADAEAYQNALQEAVAHHDAMLQENDRYYREAMEAISSNAADISNVNMDNIDRIAKEIRDSSAAMEEFTSTVVSEMDDYTAWGIQSAYEYRSKIGEYKEDILLALKDIDLEAQNTYFTLLNSVVDAGGAIGEENEKIVDTFLSLFDDVPADLQEDAAVVIRSIVAGMESQIPALKNASNMTAGEIADTLRNYLMGADKKAESLGSETVLSIIRGARYQQDNLTGAMLGIFGGAVSAVNGKYGLSIGSNGVINGSHSSGLDYVPFDGYIAELHKGEMVLTSEEADAVRSGVFVSLESLADTFDAMQVEVDRIQRGMVSNIVLPELPSIDPAAPGRSIRNYGGFNIQIYQQPGEDMEEFAYRVADVLQSEIEAREAVFGVS